MEDNEYLGAVETLFPSEQLVPSRTNANEPVPQAPVNEYEQAVDEALPDPRVVLERSVNVASNFDPDRHAKVLRLSEEMRLPPAIVDRNYEQIQKERAKKIDYDTLVNNSPGTSAFLQEPDQASVARDDIESLTKMEGQVRDYSIFESLYNGIGSGVSRAMETALKIPAAGLNVQAAGYNALARVLGLEEHWSPEWLRNNYFTRYYEDAVKSFDAPEFKDSISSALKAGDWGRAARVGAVNFAANFPQLAAILTLTATGNPALVGLAAGGAGLMETSRSQDEALDEGKDPLTATLGSIGKGGAEAIFEHLKLGLVTRWSKAIASSYGEQTTRRLLQDVFKTLIASPVQEYAEEAGTQFTQSLIDYAMGDEKALENIIALSHEAGLQGAFAGAILTGPSTVGAGIHRAQQVQQAQQAKAFYLALGESAEASKLRERLPESQKKFIETITKGTPVENVYIDPEKLDLFFQKDGQNPIETMQKLGVLEAYEQAKATNSDVQIPLSSWVNNFVGQNYYVELADDVKFDPKGLSVNELKEQEKRLEETAGEAKQEQTPVEDQLIQVRAHFAEQFKATGKYTPQQVKDLALYETERYRARADILGEDPLGLLSGAPKIQAVDEVPGQALQQADINDFAITWETVPSPSVNQELATADESVKAAFNAEAVRIVKDESGKDLLAEKLGIPQTETSPSTGAYEGQITPNVITGFPNATPEQISAYARAVQFIFRQNAVPYFRAIPYQPGMDTTNLTQGVVFEFAEDIDSAQEKRFFYLLRQALHENAGYTKTSPTQIVILNFEGMDAEKFASGLNNLKVQHGEELKISGLTQVVSEGDYGPVHDWAKDPAGTSLRDHSASSAGSPDLQAWLDDRRKAADALNEKWAGPELEKRRQEVAAKKPLFQRERALAPTFYSKLIRTIEEKMGNSATAEQVRGLTKDIKAEEKKWLGLEEFLKGKEKVSKQELLDFLRANDLQVVEVTKEEAGTATKEFNEAWDAFLQFAQEDAGMTEREAKRIGDRIRLGADVYIPEEVRGPAERLMRASENYDKKTDDGGAKYSQYTLPGGDNYREVLFTLPERDGVGVEKAKSEFIAAAKKAGLTEDQIDFYVNELVLGGAKYEFIKVPAALDREGRALRESVYARNEAGGRPNFRNGHWEEKNVLAFVRLKDRVDADGKKVLFVEEVQSDWHQQGRKAGYVGHAPIADIARVVPDAPFKTTWHEFALKRIIRMAAEGGYDRVAWTTGEQQAERYDLSKKIEAVEYDPKEKWLHAYNFSGPVVNKHDVEPDQLEQYIGKDLAKKLLETKPKKVSHVGGKKMHVLSGLDLKVGGEGMKGFYDKIIPDFLRKFGKKFGASVGTTRLSQGESAEDALELKQDVHDGSWRIVWKGTDRTYEDEIGGKYENYADEQEADEILGTISLNDTLKTHSLDLTPALKKAALEEGFPLFQADQTITRGFFERHARLIGLLPKANLSTAIHELAHSWFQEFQEDRATILAKDPTTLTEKQKQFLKDGDTLLAWLGAKSFEAITTAQQEKFAEAWEAYVSEGKAPSKELRSAFARFRLFLVRLGRTLLGLNVDLQPEVKDLFGRMVATSDQIEAAAQEQNLSPLDPALLGLQGADAEKLLAARAEAQAVAEAHLEETVLADIRRQQTAEYKKRRKEVRAEVEKEVNLDRTQVALAILQKGTLPDGSALPEFVEAVKLDKAALKKQFPEGLVKKLPRGVSVAEAGVHPDVAADMFGFRTGTDLIVALANSEKRDDMIERITDERMKKEFGDLLTDPRLPDEAMKALHNDARSKLLRIELEYLMAMKPQAVKQAIRLVSRRLPTDKEVREYARGVVAGLKLSDIKPYVYQRAEAKAAKDSGILLSRGDIEAAIAAKKKEYFNHELYRAAVEAEEQVEKQHEFFRRLSRGDDKLSRSRDVDLVNAARSVLAAFGMDKTEKRPQDYLRAIQQYDPETYATIAALIESTLESPVPYDQLTVRQFQKISDTVGALWDLAKSEREIEIDGQRLSKEVVIGEIQAQLLEMKTPGKRAGYDRQVTKWDKAKLGLMGMRAGLRRMESWADAMDSGGGVIKRYLVRPVFEGVTRYRLAKTEKLKQFRDLIAPIENTLTKDPIQATELGYTFSGRSELLGALLHSGNGSNLQKLLRGRGWGTVDAEGNLDRSRWDAFITRLHQEGVLTKSDWDTVQAIWDLMEELKPLAQRAHKKLYGFYFDEVTADAFQTPFGIYRGGYAPAVADPFVAQDAAIREERNQIEKLDNSFMFPTTGRGFTKGRVEAYAAPLMMDLRLIPSHIDKVLRFVHIEPETKQVSKLIWDHDLREALDAFDPAVASDLIVPWLQRTAQQAVSVPMKGKAGRALDTFFREVRKRTGLNLMTANAVNAFQQLTGFSLSAVKVKPGHLLSALWRYKSDPKGVAEQIRERSDFMKTRTDGQIHELTQNLEELILNPSRFERMRDFAQQHGYFLQSAMQNLVDNVTWAGAYDQAVAKGLEEMAAVREADEAVRLTQGSFNPEDISRFEAGNSFSRLFTIFQSFFNMQANLLGTEFTRVVRDTGLKKGAGRALYVYTMGFMLPAVLAELIMKGAARRLDDDEDDEYIDDLVALFFGSQFRTATAMFPGVGPTVLAAANRFNTKWYDDRVSLSPAITAIEALAGTPASVYSAAFEDGNKKQAVRDALTAIGLFTGLPVQPLSRPLGYLVDVQEGEAEPQGVVDFGLGLVTGKK